MPHPNGHPIVPTSLTAVPQRMPFQRKPRLLRGIKADLPAQGRYRLHADGHSAVGEAGLGPFYEAQEEAAHRIALRLHDESAQMLATVYMQLAVIARDCPDSTVKKINEVIGQLDEVREQLRGLSHELSPPILDQLGLMPALKALARGVRDRSGLKIVVCGNIDGLPRLMSAVLYRVVQEALSNVVRHAQATEASVRLSIRDHKVLCVISDDGIGFDPKIQKPDQHSVGSLASSMNAPVYGLGLSGIQERVTALNGHCQISSGPTGGMQLQVEIPL